MVLDQSLRHKYMFGTIEVLLKHRPGSENLDDHERSSVEGRISFHPRVKKVFLVLFRP